MAESISTQLVPLVSVVAGAVIALAGGWLKDWAGRREKQKCLRREKLERLCNLVCSLKPWTDVLETTLAFGLSNEQPASPLEEIEVLATLYFPELLPDIKAILVSAQKFKGAMLMLSSKRLQSGQPSPDAGEMINSMYQPLSSAISKFLASTQSVAKGLG